MKTMVRCYNHASDYDAVGDFLVRTYSAAGKHINWLQPRWEYMHYHGYIWNVDLSSIGVWEAAGRIVGVVHPEHRMGAAYFEIEPGCESLRSEMLAHAERYISAADGDGRTLDIYIDDADDDFQRIAADAGYAKGRGAEQMSHFVIPNPFPAISLPTGFRLKSLAEDNDLAKLNRVIYRGFNHGAEPPDDGIADREFFQSAPNYRKDLNIVVEAPSGEFAAYSGMWYEPVHRIAYVEPVCTDPDYRRMGLASAAVLEGIRRCGEQGATVAYVGAILPVYLSLGFRQIFNCSIWRREWA